MRAAGAVSLLALVGALSCAGAAPSLREFLRQGGRGANPISRASGLLDLSRPGDPVCRQVFERADHFGADDRRGDRLRPAQRGRLDGFAAARSECRGAWRIFLWGSGRAGNYDLRRPRDRNLSLQFLALRDVGRAGRRQDLRTLTGPRMRARPQTSDTIVGCSETS